VVFDFKEDLNLALSSGDTVPRPLPFRTIQSLELHAFFRLPSGISFAISEITLNIQAALNQCKKHPKNTPGLRAENFLGLSYSGRQVLSTNPTQTGLEEIHLKGLPHPQCSRDPGGWGKKKITKIQPSVKYLNTTLDSQTGETEVLQNPYTNC